MKSFTPRIPSQLREKCLKAALDITDWCVRNQARIKKPFWDANQGRFPYNYYIPGKQRVEGIGWTHARGIMILLTAWNGTGNRDYLLAALRAGLYLKSSQDTACPDPKRDGIIYEELPQSDHIYPRDASEVAESFIYLDKVTGDREWSWRANRYAEWFVRNAVDRKGWPVRDVYPDKRPNSIKPQSYQIGNGKLFYRLEQALGSEFKRTKAGKEFDIILKGTLKEFVSEEGGIRASPASAAAEGEMDHHSGRGADAHLTINDDGAGVVLVMAYLRNRDPGLRDIIQKYSDWTCKHSLPFPLHSAFPSMANFLLDWHRCSGDKRALQWVVDNLDRGILSKQINGGADAIRGAIRGEDEPTKYYFGGDSTDYICMRTNAYAAMVLFKLAGGRFWSPGYSAYGLEELRRARMLPTRKEVLGV